MFPIVEPTAGAGVVLVGVEPEVAEVAEHAIGDGALLARRAGHGGELEEEVEGLGRPRRGPW